MKNETMGNSCNIFSLSYRREDFIFSLYFSELNYSNFSLFPIGDDTESTGLLNCFFTFSSRMLSDASMVL